MKETHQIYQGIIDIFDTMEQVLMPRDRQGDRYLSGAKNEFGNGKRR